MGSAALPLSQIVDVVVLVSPQSQAPPQFNQGCIIGPSAVITPQNRVVTYASTSAMLTAGFSNSSPEFLAAELYFGQSPPPLLVQIGRQDLTSIASVQPHSANEGTGYQVGDVLAVGGAGTLGQVQVTSIGGGGAVTGVSIVGQSWNAPGTTGTGYAVASGVTTTGGHGTGAEIDILAVGDSALAALEACRIASSTWWAVMVTDAVTADHEAIAAFVESMQPVGCYFFTTQDAAVLNNTVGNVFAVLAAQGYTRTFGIYSTTQGGLFPNNIYAAAACIGRAMGLNTGLANSYFTEMFKTLTGIGSENGSQSVSVPTPITLQQVLNIQANGGNLYTTWGGVFTFLSQGRVFASATYLDQRLNRDLLASNIQFALMNLLVDNASIPQTDPGETQLIHAVNQECDLAVQIGYLAPGTWTGVTIINLDSGDPLPLGYLAQAYPYNTQLPAARAARQAMPIYLAVCEAGAVQSILIGVYVQAA